MAGKKDNFLRNVMIGFVVVLGILMGVLFVLQRVNPTLDYDDFDQVGYYEMINSMPEGDYVVYFYSETCTHCMAIKENTMAFGHDNALGLKLYLLDAQTTLGDRTVVNLGGQEMNGTPTLLVIHNNQLVDYYIGDQPILDFYEGVENGSYTFE